nr:hypothetical protein [uncultured Haemophilus sp.]
MKEFNLEQVANGVVVVLRNGNKAVLIGRIPENIKTRRDKDLGFPLVGSMLDENGHLEAYQMNWALDGRFMLNMDSQNDIIGIWEEPIKPEDLPKPFKPKDGEPYFYINGGVIEYESEFWGSNKFDIKAAKRGNCFRTEEDVKKWLDFMKSMVE